MCIAYAIALRTYAISAKSALTAAAGADLEEDMEQPCPKRVAIQTAAKSPNVWDKFVRKVLAITTILHLHLDEPTQRFGRNLSPKSSIWSYRTTICPYAQKIGQDCGSKRPARRSRMPESRSKFMVLRIFGHRCANHSPSDRFASRTFQLRGGKFSVSSNCLKVRSSCHACLSSYPVFSLV